MAASAFSSRARSAISRLAFTRLSSSSSFPPRLRRPSPLPAISSFASSSSSVPHLHHQIRFRTNPPVDSSCSLLNSDSNFGDERPTEMAALFPGCDYEHWLIVMDKPGGEGASKKEMIDCYIRTLAKVVGSEEEAKKKIYNVSCDRFFGFGCEIDEETSSKLEGLPGVLFVLPDSYVDVEHKDYGAELFVDGEIVQRPLERMFKIEPESSLSVRSRHAEIRNDRARGVVRES